MVANKKVAPRKKVVPKAKKVGRRDPVVAVRKVGSELPRHATPRSMRYRDAMAQVRSFGKRAGWASIATFDSPNGAAQVRREILAGRRPIDGRLDDWEIESRRTRDDAGEITGSELFVRLV